MLQGLAQWKKNEDIDLFTTDSNVDQNQGENCNI